MQSKCSINNLIALLGKKWTFPIITSLKKNKQLSYNALQKMSKNRLNPRALSLSLKELIKFKIVQKEKIGTRIVYSLTENGEKLSHLAKSFKSWCHINEMSIPSGCSLNCLSCELH